MKGIDRNTVIGVGLIMLIWVGYMMMIQPSQEELAERRHQDSLAQVQAEEAQRQAELEAAQLQAADSAKRAQQSDTTNFAQQTDTTGNDTMPRVNRDSLLRIDEFQKQFGDFAESAQKAADGKGDYITIENEQVKLTISKVGGRIVTAELKEYSTYDSLPLLLMDEDSSSFNIRFTYDNRGLNTEELWFEPQGSSFSISGDESKALSLRMYGPSKSQYIEYMYTLSGSDYMVDFDIKIVGMPQIAKNMSSELELYWAVAALSKEKGIKYERDYSTLFWKYEDEVDNLSERGDDEENLIASTKWVSFSQQFFSATFIADDHFGKDGSDVAITSAKGTRYTKFMEANLAVPLAGETPSFGGRFYFGPNHYNTLQSYDLELQEQVNFGPSFIAWFSKLVIVPIFNALDDTGMGYGLIILLLTLLIKTLLFPITYKSFMSSARMKALKPEIDEINEKYKDKDAMEKQRATMALYKKAGVSPTAGCIPMLLQFPILLAMYRFFPASIELRQQPFLWAEDLSAYDSIFTFPAGFEIPWYGDHVSLFTLLMATSTFFYTRYNMSTQATGGAGMAQMKVIAYLMPVMLLFWFNDYASGLSYYYLTANVISIGQHLIIKKFFINEDEIRRKIQENKKKPVKRSKFQKRLDSMMKEQQAKQGRARK